MNRFYIFLFIFFPVCTPAKILNVAGPGANDFWIQFLLRGKFETIEPVFPETVREDTKSLELEWTLLIGAPNANTTGKNLAVDRNGFIYVAGDTNRGVYRAAEIGTRDLILGKYDSLKNTIWTKQVGVAGVRLQVADIAVDPDGNVYVTGQTNGNYANPLVGADDMFLIKFNSADGTEAWVRQIGVPGVRIGGGGFSILPEKISVDTFGNSYIVGNSTGPFGGPEAGANGFMIKFDTNGNQEWVTQLSIPRGQSFPKGVAFDRITGDIYMTGSGNANFETDTTPSIGNSDLFILRYDGNNGNKQFFAQLGSALRSSEGRSLSVDPSGNVFVGGNSNGDFGSGADGTSWLGTLVKYDSFGNQQWIRQFGPISGRRKQTAIEAIVTDADGNVFTTGHSNGNVPDGTGISIGTLDVFLTKHDSSGQNRWIRQVGTPGATISGSGIGRDRNGNLYGIGNTNHTVNGIPIRGLNEIFIVKYK
ncbi:SBBP repeat beta-propeller lipoprotein, LipL53 family [Leptospira weilii]